MTSSARGWIHIVGMVCGLLATRAIAQAQSAVDGFNPGANGSVLTMEIPGSSFTNNV